MLATAILLLCLAIYSQTPTPPSKGITGQTRSSVNSRLLIVEAEDLGMAHSIDACTFEAFDKRWVTSASVLVAAPWFPEVAFWANGHRQADIGVQLDLTADWKNYSWRPVSPQPSGSSLIGSKCASFLQY